MFLRVAAATCAVLAIGLVSAPEPADAQGYPYVYRGAPPPPPYAILPELDDEQEVVVIPDRRPGLPYPERQDRYVPPAPGFVPPEQAAPYGHIPGRDRTIQRGELPPLPPADINAPRPPAGVGPSQQSVISTLPPEDQPEVGEPKELPPQFRRQTRRLPTKEPAGTIIIDTPNTYLYLVLGDGRRCATASASAAKDSPGPAPRGSAAWRNGRTGIRRRR